MSAEAIEKDNNSTGSRNEDAPTYDAEKAAYTEDGLVRGETKAVSNDSPSQLQLLT
jgi:hypothetical protein